MTISDQRIQNPIKKIREELNLTQKEYAKLACVTEQVVLKAEQGLYPTLPPSIMRVAVTESNLSVGLIEAMYEDWILQELRDVKLPTTFVPSQVGFYTPDQFIGWRAVVCRMNGVPNSVNGFCKLFKINPYVIQKYEGGKMKSIPLQLVERIAFIRGELN